MNQRHLSTRVWRPAIGASALVFTLGIALPVLGQPTARAATAATPRVDLGSVSMAMSQPLSGPDPQLERYYHTDCIFAGYGTNFSTTRTVYDAYNNGPWQPRFESWVGVTPQRPTTDEWSYVSHGKPVSGYSAGYCPPEMQIANQSSIGVRPALPARITVGKTFNIGMIRHNNNPIYIDYPWFFGDFQIAVDGKKDTFSWQQWETNNTCTYKVDSAQTYCSDDILYINKNHSESIYIDRDGMRYFLNIWGFYNADSAAACPDDPGFETPHTKFITQERRSTNACIYASFNTKRTVKIAKTVTYGPGIPNNYRIPSFEFNLTQRTEDDQWFPRYPNNFALRPTTWGESGRSVTTNAQAISYMVGVEDIKVSESAPSAAAPGKNWTLTGVTCVDADGANVTVPSTAVDFRAGTLSLKELPAPTKPAEQNLTCTFNNHVTAVKETGTIDVKKILKDPDKGLIDPDQSFTVRYSCKITDRSVTLPNSTALSGQVEVRANQKATITNLPIGAECTFTEDTPDPRALKNSNFSWRPVQVAPARVTVPAESVASVTVTNEVRYTPAKQLVTVAKVDADSRPLTGAKFTLYDRDPKDSGASPIATGSTTGDTGKHLFPDLIVDKVYWLVETQAPFGHQLLPHPVPFRLTQKGIVLAESEEKSDTLLVTRPSDFTIQVRDIEVGVMPESGGIGLTPYVALGVSLLTVGGGIAVLQRRRRI